METSLFFSIWVFPKIGKQPKMDGLQLMEPICPLFLAFTPPKQGLFPSKQGYQGSFGFQVLLFLMPNIVKLIWSYTSRIATTSSLLVIFMLDIHIYRKTQPLKRVQLASVRKVAIAARRRCTAASRLPWKRLSRARHWRFEIVKMSTVDVLLNYMGCFRK